MPPSQAPTSIVPEQLLLTEEEFFGVPITCVTNIIMFPFLNLLELLAQMRLLRNTSTCAQCNVACNFTKFSSCIDGYAWRCRLCRKRKSIRDGSYFSKSHLSLQTICILLGHWAYGRSQDTQAEEAMVSLKSAVVWASSNRAVVRRAIMEENILLGGFNEEKQENSIVEIDETMLFKRFRTQEWVFGGVERGTNNCFMVVVSRRSRGKLLPLIKKYILPGTTIMTDSWGAYDKLDEVYNGIYMHGVVSKEHFVSPVHPDIHIQGVQSMWSRFKGMLHKQQGCRRTMLNQYAQEFIWRERCRGKDTFLCFLLCVRRQYIL